MLEVAAEKGRAGISGVMATVLARHGSAPATPGQKLYCATDGTCVGTVGGGAVEREVLGALGTAIEALRASAEPEKIFATRSFHLGQELGMCCGGGVDVVIEADRGARSVFGRSAADTWRRRRRRSSRASGSR